MEVTNEKKVKKWMVLMLAVMLSAVVTVPVKSERKSWEFNKAANRSFTNLASGSKADEEVNWYVTLNKTKYTNISGTNRFQCKVLDGKTGGDASVLVTISSYAKRKATIYTLDVYPKYTSKLVGRKDPKSTTKGNLVLWGYFTP